MLNNPKEIIERNEQTIYQSIVNFTKDSKEYLVRMFINKCKSPKVVITVYKTSKIKKYYES